MKKCLVLLLLAVTATCWAIPLQINYQGYLTRPDGSPLDTTVAMTFRIYEFSYGGNMVWMEPYSSVVVANGIFNVLLGSVVPLPDVFSVDRWLEIQVGDDLEMTPRTPMAATLPPSIPGSSG